MQRILEEMVHLDPFHLGFKLRGNTKMALIILVSDLWWDLDVGGIPMLAFLDLPAIFNVINHSIFLAWFQGLDVESTMLQ